MQKETNMGGAGARPYGGQPQGGQTHSSVWTRFIRRMRTDRRTELLVYGGVALLVVVLYLFVSRAADGGTAADADGVQVLSAANAADTETRLQEVLSCIRGAGRVEVMITYETGREIVPAMTTSVNSNGSETSDGDKSSSSQQSTESTQPATVSQSGSNAPIVLKEIEPGRARRHCRCRRRGGCDRAIGPASARCGQCWIFRSRISKCLNEVHSQQIKEG